MHKYKVCHSDLILIQFKNDEGESLTENERALLYSPDLDKVFMMIPTDAFRGMQQAKNLDAAFTIYNGQVFAELDFFRKFMADDPENLDRLNTMEANAREAIRQ